MISQHNHNTTQQTTQHPTQHHTQPPTQPIDILDQLGLLSPEPSSADTQPETASTTEQHAERRNATRHPTARKLKLVMLAGDRPLGQPFEATASDVSSTGIRITGNAPLLQNARAAIQLETPDGKAHILGATIKHSTFGSPSQFTPDNTATAGLEFHALPATLIAQHFTTPTGEISIEHKPT